MRLKLAWVNTHRSAAVGRDTHEDSWVGGNYYGGHLRRYGGRLRLEEDDLLLYFLQNLVDNVLGSSLACTLDVERFWTFALSALNRSAMCLVAGLCASSAFLWAPKHVSEVRKEL